MTSIHIFDPRVCEAALLPLPIGALVVAMYNLLQEGADLPQPRYVTEGDTQNFSLQFGGDPSSFKDIARWANRFGGVVQTRPHEMEDGQMTSYVTAEFDYYGIAVKAYAFIPAGTAAA